MGWKNSDGVSTLMVSEESPIDAFIVQLCEKITSDLIPENEDVNWNYIRFEFWGDSGRLVVFPATTSESNRIEKTVCQVVFAQLLSEYEDLADSDIDDAEFTNRWKTIIRGWSERIVNIARASELKDSRFIFWDAEDEQPIKDIVI